MEAVTGRRFRRFRAHTSVSLLPRHSNHQSLTNTVSCWYCDFKMRAFNEPLFRIGRKYDNALKLWFSVGVGFGISVLFFVSLVLLIQLYPNPFTDQFATVLFGFPLSSRVSISGVLYVFVSTLMSVSVHEFGHALAAASEGIRLEYIAIFIATLFPGALVAFDHDLLQELPRFTALRVYCAGIWHNAVFCAFCVVALIILPFFLLPFYIHGESAMVLDVPLTSPLYGYISSGDIITSFDGTHIHNPKEWMEMASLLDKTTLQSANGSMSLESFKGVHGRMGYCVPSSLMEGSDLVQLEDEKLVCPSDLTAFVAAQCSDDIRRNDTLGEDVQANKSKNIFCLNAKEIVKLNKCGDGYVTSTTLGMGCVCSQGEFCLSPVQFPGLTWTEITYISSHSPECSNLERSSLEQNCTKTFVFIGAMVSMANSIHLTAYQPRWSLYFGLAIPYMLERSLVCTFHVSLTLVLLNGLPVYYLDGESILEVSMCYLTWISPVRRKIALQVCLVVGTISSVIALIKMIIL